MTIVYDTLEHYYLIEFPIDISGESYIHSIILYFAVKEKS